jgi:hypothetical protein
MGRTKNTTKRKSLRNLKIMEKLKYNEDYTEYFYLFGPVVLGVAIISGGVGLVLLPLFFFYLAAVQLYSGVALNMWNWGWGWNGRVVAKYTKDGQPDLFYLNVVPCILLGVIVLSVIVEIFLSII